MRQARAGGDASYLVDVLYAGALFRRPDPQGGYNANVQDVVRFLVLNQGVQTGDFLLVLETDSDSAGFVLGRDTAARIGTPAACRCQSKPAASTRAARRVIRWAVRWSRTATLVPAATGDRCEVEIRGQWVAARLVKPPFVRHGKVLV